MPQEQIGGIGCDTNTSGDTGAAWVVGGNAGSVQQLENVNAPVRLSLCGATQMDARTYPPRYQ